MPEHCIEYVRLLLWPKENPFSNPTEEAIAIDGDDPQHISWIYEKSHERAIHVSFCVIRMSQSYLTLRFAFQYGIQGVTYRLTQGVVKRIIPAVASTNSVIAASCAMEVFKLATSCANPLQNYMVFNDSGMFLTKN